MMTKTWTRLCAAVAVLALLGVPAGSASAGNYKLISLVSSSSFQAFSTAPSINNHGHVAWRSFNSEGDSVIVVHDGTAASVVFNLTDAGFGVALGNAVINDAGAVAITACGGLCVMRVDPDGTATVLARADPINGTGDFREFQFFISMNSSGQVAAAVTKHDGTPAVVRLDASGITEIAVGTPEFQVGGWVTLNDAGRVAFAVSEPNVPDCPHSGLFCQAVYSGTGGPLTMEGRRPTNGGSGFAPFIRSDGLVLDTGVETPAVIYTAQGEP